MNKKRCLIYGLVDPRSLLIRYIGKSMSGMVRPNQHKYSHQLNNRTHRSAWIKGLLRAGLMYEVVVLEDASRDGLSDLECWWIAYGRALGWPLTNMTNGGDGALGRVRSQESRNKISGDNSPMRRPEVKAKLSGENSPAKRPEVRQKQRELKLGDLNPMRRPGAGDRCRGDNSPMRRPEVRAKLSASKLSDREKTHLASVRGWVTRRRNMSAGVA